MAGTRKRGGSLSGVPSSGNALPNRRRSNSATTRNEINKPVTKDETLDRSDVELSESGNRKEIQRQFEDDLAKLQQKAVLFDQEGSQRDALQKEYEEGLKRLELSGLESAEKIRLQQAFEKGLEVLKKKEQLQDQEVQNRRQKQEEEQAAQRELEEAIRQSQEEALRKQQKREAEERLALEAEEERRRNEELEEADRRIIEQQEASLREVIQKEQERIKIQDATKQKLGEILVNAGKAGANLANLKAELDRTLEQAFKDLGEERKKAADDAIKETLEGVQRAIKQVERKEKVEGAGLTTEALEKIGVKDEAVDKLSDDDLKKIAKVFKGKGNNLNDLDGIDKDKLIALGDGLDDDGKLNGKLLKDYDKDDLKNALKDNSAFEIGYRTGKKLAEAKFKRLGVDKDRVEALVNDLTDASVGLTEVETYDLPNDVVNKLKNADDQLNATGQAGKTDDQKDDHIMDALDALSGIGNGVLNDTTKKDNLAAQLLSSNVLNNARIVQRVGPGNDTADDIKLLRRSLARYGGKDQFKKITNEAALQASTNANTPANRQAMKDLLRTVEGLGARGKNVNQANKVVGFIQKVHANQAQGIVGGRQLHSFGDAVSKLSTFANRHTLQRAPAPVAGNGLADTIPPSRQSIPRVVGPGSNDVYLSQERLRHVKAGHTFENFEFTAENINRNGRSTFFPVGTTDQQIIGTARQAMLDPLHLTPISQDFEATDRVKPNVGGTQYQIASTWKPGPGLYRTGQFFPLNGPNAIKIDKSILTGIEAILF